ncbi:MAG: monofunctional biosynthetic peptidoglycan transglycosylase [Bacteroidetes bacterium]|nr:monofunctional biosynthetic peptidoglycan transglycosylase [Bacteroidota bacterium]
MLKRIFRILFKACLWFIAISIVSVLFFRFVPIPVTPLMLIRCVEQKWDGKEMKLKKDWVPLEKISSAMPLAVIAAEDQKFEEHFGFDLEAIKKAEKYNKRHQGKKTKGASTISQQTAKNVFLWPNRSWIRKGFEVYFTFLIEIFWSKQRIMEVYLNVIEMGNGVYGVEAAAQEYFHKPASKLSVREAALIAAILPSPLKWSPVKPNARVQKKASRIMHFISRLKLDDF